MAGGVDPFRIVPGTRSGRIPPAGVAPPEGDFVYCFGNDDPGWTSTFAPGDEVAIAQTGDWSPAEMLRWRATFRGPSEMPSGWAWYFVARISGVEVWRAEVQVDRERAMFDLGVATAGLAATITLGFALLVEGPSGETAELEIPAVYLDDLILDAGVGDYVVANRDPQESASDVPRDSAIAFDLVDTTGSAPAPGQTFIWVDGVLAYNGGSGATVGFAVTESVPVAGQRRFSIDVLPMLFESEALVTVRVVSENIAGTASLDETWTFTARDETPPQLIAAQARELRRVRATFDEAIRQVSAASGDDALRVANWSLEPVQPDADTPAVPVGVLEIESVTDRVVDVLLDDDPSPGIEYDLVVRFVKDLRGNEVVAPLNRARFVAFVPPRPALRRWDLWEFWPDLNVGEDLTRDLLRLTRCLQELEDLRLWDLDRWVQILDPDIAPERYLDAILSALGNPFAWVEELSEIDKRRLVRVLVGIYKQKGTAVGIVNTVRFFLGFEVLVVPYSSFGWILDVDLLGSTTILGTDVSRLLYSFEILAPVVLTESQRRRIAQIADYMKPAHEHHVRTLDASEAGPYDHLVLGVSILDQEWILHGP